MEESKFRVDRPGVIYDLLGSIAESQASGPNRRLNTGQVGATGELRPRMSAAIGFN